MIVRALKLRGWRNLAQQQLEPGPRVTVLYGPNGQGKTNIIEALTYVVTFRSFRTRDNDDLLAWGESSSRVELDLTVGGLERRLAVTFDREHKRFELDGKAVRRDADSLRGACVVLFVPDDLALPKAAPSERRRFLDGAIFATDRAYYREALVYQRALRSRNAVLKSRPSGDLLDAYDEALARAGVRILLRRRAFVRALNPQVQHAFARMHEDLPIDLAYVSHREINNVADDEAELLSVYIECLRARRLRDHQRGFTGFGVHTDDLALRICHRPASEHASQGQLRSAVLALKFGELSLVEFANREPPLLLLDDVTSELDETRRHRLFETLAGFRGQCVLSMTDRALFPALESRVDFELARGLAARVL